MSAAPPLAPVDDGIRIGFYEDWMADEVVEMFVAQYGGTRDEQSAAFHAFYESPFQRPHGIRIVAVDGERVCGFQSFFFWPYEYGGRQLRTFQSGNSLVHADYRGRRIFARLLGYLDQAEGRPSIDFLTGFPHHKSRGSLIRNGWINPFDLAWYGRPLRPLSVLRRAPGADDWRFDREPEVVDAHHPGEQFSMSQEADFAAWRRATRTGGSDPYFYFHHRRDGRTIRFDLKSNRRGRVHELVLGGINRDSLDPALLRGGLRTLVRAARGHRFLSVLTAALNRRCRDKGLLHALWLSGFVPLKWKICFCVKQLGPVVGLEEAARWEVLRSDVDTW